MKKLLSLIIVLSMLAVMLVACSQAPEATNGEETKDTVAATGTSADSNLDEWGRPLVESALPADLNFGGEVINIYCDRAHSADLTVEELNDDIINDAVYNRNIKVEEDLGVDLNWIFSDAAPATKAFAGEVDAIVFNSTGDYDIVMGYGYFLPCMVPVNTYSNLYNIPYLDFEKPWWNQIYVEQATLNGQMYTCVGDLSLSSTYGAGCIFFNKRLADEHFKDIGGSEGIYKLVMDGKWTIDKFTELVKDKWIDSDGDGQRSEGDFYGFGSRFAGPIPCNSFQYGMDAPITREDEKGIPYLTYNTEKTVNALNKLYTLAFECDGVWTNTAYYSAGDGGLYLSKFINGNMIFAAEVLSTANNFRDMKDDYGLLPMPKYDDVQEKYYTSQADGYTAFAIPWGIETFSCSDGSTSRDYLAGAVLEKLNEESYRSVAPNYFEVVMKYRYIRSEDSEDYDLKIYDMILAGNDYNFGLIYSVNIADVSFKFRHMIGKEGSNDFASMWNSIESNVVSSFDALLSYFEEV